MNRLAFGLTLGIVAGVMLVEASPEIKHFLDKGKQKLMQKKEG